MLLHKILVLFISTLALPASSAQPQAHPCDAAEYRQFDF